MGFADWFVLGLKKNKKVHIKKVKNESVDMGTMASGHPSEAAGALARLMDQKTAPTKVLMVQDGDYVPQVTDYAIKMAQRLDCDIIALDVSAKPLQFSGDRKDRETARFLDMAKKDFEKFSAQTTARGIKVEHIMDIGDPEEILCRVSAADAGIRYVLSKPDNDEPGIEQDCNRVPVFDLHCSRL